MFEGLHIGRSGLAAAQRGLEVAGHNVANVNTKGYSRQRVEQATATARPEARGLLGPGATGSGVVVTGTTRLRDRLLDLSYRDAVGESAGWDTRAELLQQAEEVLGPVDRGIPEALDRYWNAWENLSLSPEDISAREEVLASGRSMASLVNTAARQLDDLRSEAAGRADDLVTEINQLATDVAKFNLGIESAAARGDQPNDLLDQRDLAIDRLAELAGARSFTQEDGSAVVTIGGLPLVDGVRTFPLEADEGPPLSVNWEVDGRTASVGGKLGSVVELATATMDSLISELDSFTIGLRDVVNTNHSLGFDLDGVAGGAFFTGAGAADFAVDPGFDYRSIAASAGGAAADGNHALVMGELRNVDMSTGATALGSLGAFAARLGLLAEEATRNRDGSLAIVDGVERQRLEMSAVSIDEELTDMLRYQRAYEASARVITVIDSMLDKLINGTGATR